MKAARDYLKSKGTGNNRRKTGIHAEGTLYIQVDFPAPGFRNDREREADIREKEEGRCLKMYWNYNREEKKKNILFLSVDDVHGNEFGSMLGGDPPYALRELCKECHSDLVLLCGSAKLKQQFEEDTAREWLKKVYMDSYFSCASDVTEQKEVKIREYLDGLDYEEYAIIDYEELEPVFPGHTVYLSDLFNDSAVRKAERILRYGSYANLTMSRSGSGTGCPTGL